MGVVRTNAGGALLLENEALKNQLAQYINPATLIDYLSLPTATGRGKLCDTVV